VPELPLVPSVVRLVFKWTVGQDLSCFNILHWKYSGGPPDNSACVLIAQTVDGQVAAGLTLSQHPSVILTEVTCTDLASKSGGFGQFLANRPGTAGGGPLPANTAVLVNYGIQRRYRGGKPRTYWPMGTDTDLQDPQTWTAAARANFLTHHNATVNGISNIAYAGGNLSQQVSVSYVDHHVWDQNNPPSGPWKSHPVYRDTGLVDVLTSHTINPSVGTMRRRVRGKRT